MEIVSACQMWFESSGNNASARCQHDYGVGRFTGVEYNKLLELKLGRCDEQQDPEHQQYSTRSQSKSLGVNP